MIRTASFPASTAKSSIGIRASGYAVALCCAVTLHCSSALAQHNFEEAKKAWPDLRLFDPDEIRGLSSNLKADLTKRSCRIPKFTKWDGQHNVVRGSFRSRDSRDVAVLCLAGNDMSVIVYFNGSATIAEEIRKFPADAYRMIHTVSPFVLGKRAIRDKATGRLPAFDHDAIDDGPVGERSETAYYNAGAWMQVF
jgi:hypothetical protein